MKHVLNHMASCKSGNMCGVAHCSSSWRMLSHWDKCKKSDCAFCAPIKQADSKVNMYAFFSWAIRFYTFNADENCKIQELLKGLS